MRVWELLKTWVEEEAQSARMYRRLAETAVLYHMDEAGLWRDPDLQLALNWRDQNQPNAAWAVRYHPAFVPAMQFLEESSAVHKAEVARQEAEAERQRELEKASAVAAEREQRIAVQERAAKRLHRLVISLAIGLSVAMILAILAIKQRSIAEKERGLAHSRQLAAQAVSYAGNQFDLALLLSLEANRLTETLEVRGSLLTVLETSPHLITFLRAHSRRVERVTFNPDSSRNMLASVGGDGQLILWDVTAHQPRDPLRARTRFVISVAFSPDGTLLALGHDDGTITLWDVATRQPASQPLTGHKGPVSSITFSPDGHTLASSSWDTTIILWDVATRKRLAPPLTGDPSPVESIAFSPDSTILASGYKDTDTVILWDVARHQQVGPPLTGHRGSTVTSIAFSPDGNTLASGAKDDTIILWDISEQRAFISSPQTSTRKGPPSGALSPPRSRTLTGHKKLGVQCRV